MLTDSEFKVVYSSGEIEPAEFFIDALLESSTFDLMLGFFSTSGFRSLSLGFAHFISCGGKMRIMFHNVLSQDDKNALEKGLVQDESTLMEDCIINDIIRLSNTLSSYDRHFFNCISWLIASKRLEMVAITPIKNSPGIAHQKFGIFKDKEFNSVAFNGSINFSANAIFNNSEALSCYKSWTTDSSDIERVKYYDALFNKIWNGQSKVVRIVPLNQVKVIIRDKFPVSNLKDIISEEYAFINEISKNILAPKSFQIKLNCLRKSIEAKRNTSLLAGQDNEQREYQQKAVDSWIANDYKGLFEMATGTGKTITGLFATVKLFEKLDRIFLLVLVPTISLAEQWGVEVQKFRYNDVLIVSSNNSQWVTNLQAVLNSFRLGTIKHVAIIATYDSFKSKKFGDFYEKLPAETMLLADEAHNMGAPEVLKKLPFNIKYRLALSATPHRHFDDSGTRKFLDFFNATGKSTFIFNMKDAIANRYLCQYKLYPHFGELNEDEYRNYIELTKQISRRAHFSKNTFTDTDTVLEKLLQERRKILNTAVSKKAIVGKIIDELKLKGDIHHTLVYCPEGNDDVEDNAIINEYGKYLAFEKGLRIAQFTGKTPPDVRRRLLEEFDEGKIQCLLAMKCLDEGVDVKRTETAIFVSSSTNPRQYVQRRGRVLRVHESKPFAFIHDIIAMPPKEGIDDDKAKDVEKIILRQEFSRFKEFASEATNYVEAIAPIKELCDHYKIDF